MSVIGKELFQLGVILKYPYGRGAEGRNHTCMLIAARCHQPVLIRGQFGADVINPLSIGLLTPHALETASTRQRYKCLFEAENVAEGVGFEPTEHLAMLNGFQDRRISPLCHPSGRYSTGFIRELA